MSLKTSSKEDSDAIKHKAAEFIQDRRKANFLIDVLTAVEAEDVKSVLAGIAATKSVFTHLLNNGEMQLDSKEKDLEEDSPEEKYKSWLRERYQYAVDRLVDLLSHEVQSVQEQSAKTLMELVIEESHHPTGAVNITESFPKNKLKLIITQLISMECEQKAVCSVIGDYTRSYYDLYCFFLKAFNDVIGKQNNKEPTDTFLQNVFNVLEQLTLSKKRFAADPGNMKLVLKARKQDERYMETLEQYSKLFDKIWFEFISWKLTPSFHRRVLIYLPEKLFAHCDNPVIFTDFFMRSYNFGGPVSLLSLNGLYILMQKYNLEYPDFYQKLYNILEPSIFHAKYKARFFYLIDMFLKSTHLPQYLVAAFIKRLARLSLGAPANCLGLTTPLIMNLLTRHPNLMKLIHNPNAVEDLPNDPYDMSEPDPAKCRAEESSLWELKILQRHYCPLVGHAAMFIGNPLPSTEEDLTDRLEMTYAEMMKKESNLNVKEIPLNYDKPRGLFLRKEDKMNQFWTLE